MNKISLGMDCDSLRREDPSRFHGQRSRGRRGAVACHSWSSIEVARSMTQGYYCDDKRPTTAAIFMTRG
ncbi:hypothetical protein TIFTF001_027865 [Ficus carica]|uniref:Uncharacterized protein n=1 Tax=Ficus carica TaxID=3494 RepID=A0AA88DNS4_FICCA|nr:hypothetical protein TIFTF001_027865 [Ficus carica]